MTLRYKKKLEGIEMQELLPSMKAEQNPNFQIQNCPEDTNRPQSYIFQSLHRCHSLRRRFIQKYLRPATIQKELTRVRQLRPNHLPRFSIARDFLSNLGNVVTTS